MITLNTREQQILKSIVRSFIQSASPVGSTRLAEDLTIGLRSASIRRIMAALEEKGYLAQPHTSAGRIPTTEGYRYYVNELLEQGYLNTKTRKIILAAVNSYNGNMDVLLENVNRSLATISQQLGIVLSPKIQQGVFHQIQLLRVSERKIMAVLTASDEFIKTSIIENKSSLSLNDLQPFLAKINHHLKNRPMAEARKALKKMLAGAENFLAGQHAFFVELEHRLFNFNHYESYLLNGTRNILRQPEFSDRTRFSKLIDLLEDRDILIHFMEKREIPPGIRITIGDEHSEMRIRSCSVITSTYASGQISGIVGIIGPTRLPYRNVIPLVEFTARAISERLNEC